MSMKVAPHWPSNWQEIVADRATDPENKMSDPRLLFALLQAENGQPGMEFGYGVSRQDPKDPTSPLVVANPKWQGFRNQAGGAAYQIGLEEEEYQKDTGKSPMWHGTYTEDFLRYFSTGMSLEAYGPTRYGGYARPGVANDPNNLNANHLENLRAAYSQMVRDPRNGEVVAAEPRTPPAMEPMPVATDPWELYGQARVEADQLSEIKQNLGPDVADRVGALRQVDWMEAARLGQRLTQPLTSYLGEKFGDAMALLAKGGRMVRGVLGGQPGEELSPEQLTGLAPEDVTHSPAELLSGGILGSVVNYPHRAANFGTEIATDPLNALLGVGMGIKAGAKAVEKGAALAKGAEKATAATGEAKGRAGTPPPEPPTGTGGTAPPPPPPPPPSPVAGITQPELDNLLKSVQATIAEARTPKVEMTAKAIALRDNGTVTLKKLLQGKVDLSDPAAMQAAQSIRQEWMRPLDELLTDTGPRSPQQDKKLRQLLNITANLDKRVRAGQGGEIPAGQTVQAARFGQGPANKAWEDTLEYAPVGSSLDQIRYMYRLMKGAKEQDEFLHAYSTFGQKLKAGLLSIQLGGLVAGTATPIWNALAMSTLTTARIFERWRMAGFRDSNTVPGEAGVFAQSLIGAYAKLLFGGVEETNRFNRNVQGFKDLTRGAGPDALAAVDPAKVARMNEIPKEMAKLIAVGKDGKTTITNQAGYDALVEELGQLRATTGMGGLNKFQARRMISKEMYGASGGVGAAIDALGHLTMSGTYAVAGTDLLFRFAIETAMAESLAYRQAFQNAFTKIKGMEGLGDPKALRAFQKELKANTDLHAQYLADREAYRTHPDTTKVVVEGQWKTLNQAGIDEADMISMMAPLEGRLKAVDQATRNSLAFRTFVPYFSVMAQTARQTVNRLPLWMNRMAPSVRADLQAGGERAARAKAQVTTGAALAAMTAGLVASGRICGGGPVNSDARADWEAAGCKPYTIKYQRKDGKWVHLPFDRAAPIGNVLGLAADIGYILPRLDTGEFADTPDLSANQQLGLELANESSQAFVHLLTNNITAADLRDVMAALAEGDGAMEKVSGILARKTPSFVPLSALGREINQAIDGEIKGADSAVERAKRVIPTLSSDLPGYHSKYGEVGEVPMEGAWDAAGLMSGTQIREFHPDDPRVALQHAMDASRVTFSAPSKTQQGVRLNDHQYERLKELIGKGIYSHTGKFLGLEPPHTANAHPEHGKTLVSTLWKMVIDKGNGQPPQEWTRGNPGPGGAREALVHLAAASIKQLAWAQLLKEDPQLATQVTLKQAYRAVGPQSQEQVDRATTRALRRKGVSLGR